MQLRPRARHGGARAHARLVPPGAAWVTDRSWTRPELEQVLHDHIRTVVGHYRGKVAEWDVVNEAVDEDGQAARQRLDCGSSDRTTSTSRSRWAHEADPDAKLYYNDYDIEFPGAEGAGGRTRSCAGCKARGVPIDGVGIQAPRADRAPAVARRAASPRSQGYAGLGLDVAITELDVGIYPPGIGRRSSTSRPTIYRDVLDACLAVSRCRTFVTWGFTDKYSWIPAELPGFGDALPFDAAYHPKPALRGPARRASPAVAAERAC